VKTVRTHCAFALVIVATITACAHKPADPPIWRHMFTPHPKASIGLGGITESASLRSDMLVAAAPVTGATAPPGCYLVTSAAQSGVICLTTPAPKGWRVVEPVYLVATNSPAPTPSPKPTPKPSPTRTPTPTASPVPRATMLIQLNNVPADATSVRVIINGVPTVIPLPTNAP
jgi:hypothetical protein